MDLKKFAFPEITDIDLAFSTQKTDPVLLKEANKRGFNNFNNKYCKLFSQLFFNGGTLNFKKDIDPDFKIKATRYLKALMSSFEPKHEEKEAICALILSELVD